MVEACNPSQAHPVDVNLDFSERKVVTWHCSFASASILLLWLIYFYKVVTFVKELSKKLVKQVQELPLAALKAAARPEMQSLEKQYQEELQRVREQAAADTKKLTENFKQQLQSKDQELACIKQMLRSSEQQCTTLEDALATKECECTEIQAQFATKTKELHMLHLAMDELQFELDEVKCKGRELLTFQGLTTSQANLNTLKVALKDLDSLCQGFTTLVWENGLTQSQIPGVVNWQLMLKSKQQEQRMCSSCIKHAVLSELSNVVFVGFCNSELTASCCNSITSCTHDPEAVLLQLQLEKKVADSWLTIVPKPDAVAQHVDTLINQYTGRFLEQLLSMQDRLIWHMQKNPVALLGTAAKRLVSAAIKTQIIASSMHSQLIRIVVPGHLQNTGLTTKPAAPAAWADSLYSPGVVPLSKDWMQPGAALVASAGAVPAGMEAAAVFCQEPGVVQLAERVGDLPEFGGKGAGQGVYKVLVKARMAVAR